MEFLLWHGNLRIQGHRSCGIGQIQSLAQELPNAMDTLKKKIYWSSRRGAVVNESD